MSPAIDIFEIELLAGKVRHGGHPVLSYCARNTVCVPDSNENRKFDKAKSTGRIDGMVATAIAFRVAPLEPEQQVSTDDWIASYA